MNYFGDNSLFELAIKNKFLSLKEFLIEKIKNEELKLCDHEDLF